MIPKHLKDRFRQSLLDGSYNLLLGSGISTDSKNGNNQFLKSAENLRVDLCKITNTKENTSLTRAYNLLNPGQISSEITKAYSKCIPGPTVKNIPKFLWRRIFTFNIDDVLENLYLNMQEKKQKLISLNFDDPFELTALRGEVQAIHLHGWVQRNANGYVFSTAEYIKIIRTMNPWMHLLSEVLSTEAFIIAGTSLNEVDLEFYLNHRTSETPQKTKGPSILIEPNPDAATRADCLRHGLLLLECNLKEFMEWMRIEYPAPPSVYDLIVPDPSGIFSSSVKEVDFMHFFRSSKMASRFYRHRIDVLPILPRATCP